MGSRILAVVGVVVVAGSLLRPMEVRALDLAAARVAGSVVAEALALGERGDWPGAERVAARSGDPVVQDIVLWRKLRAGRGSVAEYRAFVSRRETWPAQGILARVAAGEPRTAGGAGLSGAAASNWQQVSRLWKRGQLDEAERILAAISPDRHKLGNPAFWAERRQILARRAARLGRAETAYRLASQHHLGPADGYDYAELEWLAGWIALRKRNDPERALAHFRRFNDSVETPISLGRGGYWVGRACEALGDAAGARQWYGAAARHQTAFYGQLAAERAGVAGDPTLTATELPDWTKSPALRNDDVLAGLVLHYAGEDDLAFAMFSEVGQRLEGGAALGALARLGLEIGRPHYAVRVAKHAARKGVLLYPAYYPVTELASFASGVEPALAMAVARQETELNPRAVSRAGARGLMQLMPGTARRVAGWIGEPYSPDRLLDDWQYNARLGETYLARRIGEFGGSYVLAAAAYNAGASRIYEWIGEFGDPRRGDVDMIDWIETIPFGETRNYVQRVIEGLYVYRARLSGAAGPMTITEDLMRGVRG